MVKKIFKLLNREISGLHEAAYLLGVFALFSHILALLRDRSLAHFFGAGETLDVYYASFRIPDFIFITVACLWIAPIPTVHAGAIIFPALAAKSDQITAPKQRNIVFPLCRCLLFCRLTNGIALKLCAMRAKRQGTLMLLSPTGY